MLKFEDYLSDFTNTVNIGDFLVNLLVAAMLGLVLKAFYVRFGASVSNRQKFASVFVPLILTTLLVITVVKASIALSLGLVGALSIVRFRAAIKEPEELTYLFMAIGIGLVNGASKPLLAIVAMAVIFPLLYVNHTFRNKGGRPRHAMFLHLRTKVIDLKAVSDMVQSHVGQVELKRYDHDDQGHYYSFIINPKKVEELNQLQSDLRAADAQLQFSVIDQPDLVL